MSSHHLAEVRTNLFFGGEVHTADHQLQIIDPADGRSIVGYAAAATAKQAEDAVASAHRAFPAWSRRPAAERAKMIVAALAGLDADRDASSGVLTRENGKIRAESVIDSMVFGHRFELAAGLVSDVDRVTVLPAPPVDTEVSYVPLGVVTIIVPFNWPLAILAASLPYALLAGNTVVVKPAPTCPLATVHTVEAVAKLLPPGVLNVVTGADAEIGAPLIGDRRVAKVSFTGSTGGGSRIMSLASGTLTRVALELGGNDAALVLDDAELDDAAIQRMFAGAFETSGQVCMAIKRLYVHRSRFDELVDKLSARLSRVRLGHGLDPDVTMGPLHHAAQVGFVQGLLDQARDTGAEVRAFGEFTGDVDPTAGNFLRPSLVLDPADHTRVVQEEQFGPTLPIVTFDDDANAVDRANDSPFGLCSSVWTADPLRAAGIGRQLRAGYTFVNAHGPADLDERAPFGGIGHSGMGRVKGVEGLREFMDTHAIGFPA